MPILSYHCLLSLSRTKLIRIWEAIKIIETGQEDTTHATNLKAVHQFTDICEGSTHQTVCNELMMTAVQVQSN
ncbi:hypothetical protein QQG55_25755 [Brugia pahangi]